MPGPLPNPNRRRRNAPAIPGTSLPAGGRSGRAPKPPGWVDLGKSGRAWWAWAWKTPQAAAWGSGDEALVARRASLEDDLSATAAVEGLDLSEALEAETWAALKSLLARLSSLSANRLGIMREMRELDDRLGLSPKGMAALRWSIEADRAPLAPVADISDYDAALSGG